MERFRDQALVLGHVDYADADRIVTLLTRDHGKVTAFAAGARKSKRRFAGALEPMTELDVALVERHGTLFRLDAADVRRSFEGVRRELPRIARALYALELVRELVREREPHPDLLDLLLDYQRGLEAGDHSAQTLLQFELQALACAGLMPRFEDCAVCAGALSAPVRFDVEHGGAVCGRCLARTPRAVPLAPILLETLVRVQSGETTALSPDVLLQARVLLGRFIRHQLARQLHGAEFMAQVGLD
ncbi:MAG: DNA repair protein RecO [Myxococcaceae bacterium]